MKSATLGQALDGSPRARATHVLDGVGSVDDERRVETVEFVGALGERPVRWPRRPMCRSSRRRSGRQTQVIEDAPRRAGGGVRGGAVRLEGVPNAPEVSSTTAWSGWIGPTVTTEFNGERRAAPRA